jgi:glycosyltransferase involved in cell wall biosynthesis
MNANSDHIDKLTHHLKIAYVIGTYPSLTTTFIDREIASLRRWGVDLQVFSIRRFAGRLSPEQEALQREVTYLLPVSKRAFVRAHLRMATGRPRAYFGTLLYLVTRPHPSWKTRFKTLLHFGEGVYAAHVIAPQGRNRLHAHFVDRAAVVALVVGRLLKVPYSVTAHANDIYVNPVLLPEKLANAKFVATCTGYNRAHLTRLDNGDFGQKIHCIYHGLDVAHYRPGTSAAGGKPFVLSVGQLKEKKGLAYLVTACRILKEQGYDLECQIVGEGPLRAELEEQIRQLSVEDTVRLCGARPHPEVIEKYRRATLFVLPCVVSANGDRDGIPNVILEAMAMQLPVVATRHSGIPEVVEDGVNGLLVPPEDGTALAEAMARLLDQPERRHEFGLQARQTIVERFSVEQNVKRLLMEFVDG